ncbi:unnamed protein product [Kuraishia capsulata CBS 1993]|uniref:SUN domain-containing protein n=1 Tax=Kuraishia capsulata CBS 1993 TaxID=1382522 RepID=W6MMK7_9ASCO|nr:uncharacterized protein KUCA_T00003770001 [Kuraishia capsulata CBS 1993]CDK27791.1 unnamed protein product [Kuraishia capsulata CBS 1993]
MWSLYQNIHTESPIVVCTTMKGRNNPNQEFRGFNEPDAIDDEELRFLNDTYRTAKNNGGLPQQHRETFQESTFDVKESRIYDSLDGSVPNTPISKKKQLIDAPKLTSTKLSVADSFTNILREFTNKRVWVLAIIVVPTVLISVVATVFYLSYAFPVQSMQDANTRFAAYDSQLRIISAYQKRSNKDYLQIVPQFRDIEEKLSNLDLDLSKRVDSLDISFDKAVKEQVQIAGDVERLSKQVQVIQGEVNKANEDADTLRALLEANAGGSSESLSEVWTRFTALQNKTESLLTEFNDKIEEITIKNEQAKRLLEKRDKNLISIDPSTGKVLIKPEFEKYISEFVAKALEQHKEDFSLQDFASKLEVNLQNEVRSKLHDEIQSIKEEVSASIASSRGSHDNGSVPQLSDFELSRLVSRIVRQEIKKSTSSQQTNYASQSQGAKIIPKVTVPQTIRRPRKRTTALERVAWGWYDFLKRQLVGEVSFDPLGAGDVYDRRNSPANVLVDDNSLWQILGHPDKVSVGISLSEPVLLNQVVLCHPNDVAPSSTAPRKIELLAKPAKGSSGNSLRQVSSGFIHENKLFAPEYIKLADLEYRKEGGSCQKFELSVAIKDSETPVSEVVILINSNWGNDDLTVLKSISIYGFKSPKTVKSSNRLGGILNSFKHFKDDIDHSGATLGDDVPF